MVGLEVGAALGLVVDVGFGVAIVVFLPWCAPFQLGRALSTPFELFVALFLAVLACC